MDECEHEWLEIGISAEDPRYSVHVSECLKCYAQMQEECRW